MEIITRSIARGVLEVDPIVLEDKGNTRIVFKPLILDKPESPIKGSILHQKKGKNDIWCDLKNIGLNELKKDEFVEITIKSAGIVKLLESIEILKNVYSKYGTQFGENKYYISDENIDDVIEQISKFGDKSKIVSALSRLESENIDDMNQLVSISGFKNVLKEWEKNKSNKDEEYWQIFFTKHIWILSQIFSAPFVFLEDKPYLGGKDLSNKKGVLGDFLYQNSITGNIAFIEIKTPEKGLVKSDYGRNGGVYTIDGELTGGINQVLNQKHTFLSKELNGQNISSFNSKCILIIGNSDSLDNDGKKKSFELFRNNLKDVEVITFDELFQKINKILNVFEDLNLNLEKEDLPF